MTEQLFSDVPRDDYNETFHSLMLFFLANKNVFTVGEGHFLERYKLLEEYAQELLSDYKNFFTKLDEISVVEAYDKIYEKTSQVKAKIVDLYPTAIHLITIDKAWNELQIDLALTYPLLFNLDDAFSRFELLNDSAQRMPENQKRLEQLLIEMMSKLIFEKKLNSSEKEKIKLHANKLVSPSEALNLLFEGDTAFDKRLEAHKAAKRTHSKQLRTPQESSSGFFKAFQNRDQENTSKQEGISRVP